MRTNIFYQEGSLGYPTSKHVRPTKGRPIPGTTWFSNPKLDLGTAIRQKQPVPNEKFFSSELTKSSGSEIGTSRGTSITKTEPIKPLQRKKVLLTRGIIIEGSPLKSDHRVTEVESEELQGKMAEGKGSPIKYLSSKTRSEHTLKVSLDNLNLRSSELEQTLASVMNYLEYPKPSRTGGALIRAKLEKPDNAAQKPMFEEGPVSQHPNLVGNFKAERKYRITTSRPSARIGPDQVSQIPVSQIAKTPMASPQKTLSQTRPGFRQGSDLISKVDIPRGFGGKSGVGISSPMYYVLTLLLSLVLGTETTILS